MLKNIIEKNIEPLQLSDNLIKGLSLIDQYHLDILPVVEKGKYLGLISINNIISPNKIKDHVKSHLNTLDKFYVNEHESVLNAIKLFVSNENKILPVVDNQNYYKGYVTAKSLLEYMVFSLGINNEGAIIEIELNKADYSLSEIAHITESNDVIIISSFLKESNNPKKVNLILKLNQKNVDRLIQSLETNNITLINSFNLSYKEEDNYKDRLDSLMSFLNI